MSWNFALPLLMVVMTICAFYGARFARVKTQFGTLIVICALASVLLMIPYIGWLLSVYCMLRLTSRLTDADFWPDSVIIAFIAMTPTILLNLLIR